VRTVCRLSWPFGVAFNPAGTFAYVANQGSNNVSAIDTAAVVIATVAVGTTPFALGNFIGPSCRVADRQGDDEDRSDRNCTGDTDHHPENCDADNSDHHNPSGSNRDGE
jgi:YVTN family beta-propeller protein